jgi:hypothetical protein
MEEIYPNLYVGSGEDYEALKKKDASKDFSFVRMCKYGTDGHQEVLGYHTLAAPAGPNYLFAHKGKNLLAVNILDINDPNFVPLECFLIAIRFIKQKLDEGRKVLAACNQGHSRGPSTGLAFLRAIGDMPHNFHTSERIYRTLYRKYDPGQGVRQRIRESWAELDCLLLKEIGDTENGR